MICATDIVESLMPHREILVTGPNNPLNQPAIIAISIPCELAQLSPFIVNILKQ